MARNYLLPLVALVIVIAGAWTGFDLGYTAVPHSNNVYFTAAAVTTSGRGVMVPFALSLSPGTGKLLVDVSIVTFKEDTESSLRKAKMAAEKYIGASLAGADIRLSFESRERIVAGESAGVAFALAIAAAYLDRPLKSDVALSAALTSDGDFVPVEGIEEKIIAARENNKNVFLVAREQTIKQEKELVEATGVKIVRITELSEAAEFALG